MRPRSLFLKSINTLKPYIEADYAYESPRVFSEREAAARLLKEHGLELPEDPTVLEEAVSQAPAAARLPAARRAALLCTTLLAAIHLLAVHALLCTALHCADDVAHRRRWSSRA
jgi:hypothetical protein